MAPGISKSWKSLITRQIPSICYITCITERWKRINVWSGTLFFPFVHPLSGNLHILLSLKLTYSERTAPWYGREGLQNLSVNKIVFLLFFFFLKKRPNDLFFLHIALHGKTYPRSKTGFQASSFSKWSFLRVYKTIYRIKYGFFRSSCRGQIFCGRGNFGKMKVGNNEKIRTGFGGR